ncbi:MAG: homoserine dehydrogenase [Clostridium sp.]
MKKYITITGYGIVAREFIGLINEKREELKEKYELDLILKAIIGTLGIIEDEKGIDISLLLQLPLGSEGLSEYGKVKNIAIKAEKHPVGDILVECTPTNIETGQPALDYIYSAIDSNMDLVVASKGALVREYKEINKRVKEKKIKLKFSCATAAALPTLNLGLECLAGAKITSIKGIFNGTSNFILSSMMENKISYDKALEIAKEKGIVERNISLDVSGMDTACKIILISNMVLKANLAIRDVDIKGIENIDLREVEEALSNNCVIKLIGRCDIQGGKIKIKVSPERIHNKDQFSLVNYSNKAISFISEETGEIFCSGGASNPRAAAYSILKDIINMYS